MLADEFGKQHRWVLRLRCTGHCTAWPQPLAPIRVGNHQRKSRDCVHGTSLCNCNAKIFLALCVRKEPFLTLELEVKADDKDNEAEAPLLDPKTHVGEHPPLMHIRSWTVRRCTCVAAPLVELLTDFCRAGATEENAKVGRT